MAGPWWLSVAVIVQLNLKVVAVCNTVASIEKQGPI